MGSAARWLGRSFGLGVVATALGLPACGRLSVESGGGAAGSGVDQGPGDGGPGGTTTIDPGVVASCKPNASLASARILLITDTQFTNAVRDVFGVELVAPLTMDGRSDYPPFEDATVAPVERVQGYLDAADQVAKKLRPCGASSPDAACMEPFLRSTLPRAWRRPIEEDEIAAILQLFKAGLAISADRAVQVTMEAVLTSGSFLYRSEIGEKPPAASETSIALTPHELATAVSFALTNSVPDVELDAKAADGSLIKLSVLSDEVDRLLATEVVQANLQKRVSYWLDIEKVPATTKDPTLFPQFTASLKDGLYQGAQKFLSDVMRQGHFSDLFTSHRVYANQGVAAVYGLPAVTGTDLVALDVPGDERGAGILTQPAVLATSNQHTGTDDIVHRGLYVYNRFACGITIGDPPPNESAVFRTLEGTESQKARQRDKLSCGACHNMFDPFGLVSEGYDPIGRHRTTEPESRGTPIDVSATIQKIGPDLDGPVNGINDLASRFAKGRRASDCAAARLTTMTLDHPDAGGDSCELQQVKDAFVKSGSFAALFKAMVTSPAFLKRDWDKK